MDIYERIFLKIQVERSDTMSKKKQEFDITGMHCAACVKRVENVVSKIDGVESVKVNLLTRKGSVEYWFRRCRGR